MPPVTCLKKKWWAIVDDLGTLPPGQIAAGIPHIGELENFRRFDSDEVDLRPGTPLSQIKLDDLPFALAQLLPNLVTSGSPVILQKGLVTSVSVIACYR